MVSVFECRFYQNSEVFEGGLTDLAPPPLLFFFLGEPFQP